METKDASGDRIDQRETLEELRKRLRHGPTVVEDFRDNLAQGGTMRQAPPIPSVNYLSVEHEILKQSVTEEADPGVVGNKAQNWIDIGEGMADFQAEFASAIDASKEHWSGEAGDAARRFLVEVGSYIGKAGTSAQLAGTQMQEHAWALENAKYTMPDPVKFDVGAAIADINQTTDPSELSRKVMEFVERVREKREAHLEAKRVADIFDRNMSSASLLPAFPAPPQLGNGGGSSDGSGGRSRTDSGGSNGLPNFQGGTGGLDGTGGVPGPLDGGVATPSAPPGIRTPGLPGPETGVTSPESFTPRPVEVAVSTGESGGRGGGAVPPGTGLAVGVSLRQGSGGSQWISGGGTRFGAGGGLDGGRGASGGPGARGPAGGGAALGGRGAGLTGGGQVGRNGGMGGVPLGAGRGDGGEDTEHQRPEYLVEPDPESVFGTDEATAPPVIGG